MSHPAFHLVRWCLNSFYAISCSILRIHQSQTTHFKTRQRPLILAAEETTFAKSLLPTLTYKARIESRNAFFLMQTGKSGIKPAREVHLPATLMANALLAVTIFTVAKQVNEVVPHRQHHPFFEHPMKKFLLRFGRINNLVYTCADKAYRFIKGGGCLFH